jgi:hypothetical protein
MKQTKNFRGKFRNSAISLKLRKFIRGEKTFDLEKEDIIVDRI